MADGSRLVQLWDMLTSKQIEQADAAFTRLFRRYERALKQTGFVDPKKGHAAADWRAFAASLDKEFFEEVCKKGGAPTLRAEPPKVNRKEGDRTKFAGAKPVNSTTDLFRAVTDVRNNLFHGDKFTGDPHQDSRDMKLVHDAAWVLEFALGWSPKISDFFNEQAMDKSPAGKIGL